MIAVIFYASFAQTMNRVGWEKESGERLAEMFLSNSGQPEAELTFPHSPFDFPMKPVTTPNIVGLK